LLLLFTFHLVTLLRFPVVYFVVVAFGVDCPVVVVTLLLLLLICCCLTVTFGCLRCLHVVGYGWFVLVVVVCCWCSPLLFPVYHVVLLLLICCVCWCWICIVVVGVVTLVLSCCCLYVYVTTLIYVCYRLRCSWLRYALICWLFGLLLLLFLLRC
jgi:hypothetical protein